jgi:hypothetical protein
MYEIHNIRKRTNTYGNIYELWVFKYESFGKYISKNPVSIIHICQIININYNQFIDELLQKDSNINIEAFYIESRCKEVINYIFDMFNKRLEPINVMEKLVN